MAAGRGDGPEGLVRGPLRWSRDGRGWPLAEHSRRIVAAGIDWHVQCYGSGPPALLVHGTGAATHSWRGLGPRLARQFTVVAPDLPGHGFTQALPARRCSLPGFAGALGELVRALDLGPALAVGHSAGAAILARGALDGTLAPRALVALNGALAGWRGGAALLFAPLARLLAATPVAPALFAWRGRDRRVVERLVANTGSRLDADGLALYARLVANPAHVAGALAMMANWDLAPLERDLPRLGTPTLFLAGAGDRTVPPSESRAAHARVVRSEFALLPGLGHLAHEEAPEAVATAILAFADRVSRSAGTSP
jgi:magnesium chelatase accessory protein